MTDVPHSIYGFAVQPNAENIRTSCSQWTANPFGSDHKKPALLQSTAVEIQKHLCGDNFKEIWSFSEPPMVTPGDGGLDREAMLQAVLGEVKDRKEFDKDMSELLSLFVDSDMNENVAVTRWENNDRLRYRYPVVRGSPESDLVLTMPRVIMSFPYEAAVRVSRRLAELQFFNQAYGYAPTLFHGGALGGLNPILAFPFAPLIIPSTWTATIQQWSSWFYSYVKHRLMIPVPFILDERIQRHISSMTSLAVEDCQVNLSRMRCLGIPEEKSPSIESAGSA